MHIKHNKRSANARLARNTFVELFIFLYPRMAVRIKRLPMTPKSSVNLEKMYLTGVSFYHLLPNERTLRITLKFRKLERT